MRRNADFRLRLAERYGDPARVLLERIRTGRVSEEQVRWAARLGDPRVVGMLRDDVLDDWTMREAIEAVARLVGGQDWERVVISYACDVMDRYLPHFERVFPGDDRPRRAVEMARSWVAGWEEHSDVVRRTSREAWDSWVDVMATINPLTSALRVASVTSGAASVCNGIILDPVGATLSAIACDVMGDDHVWQRRLLARYALGEAMGARRNTDAHPPGARSLLPATVAGRFGALPALEHALRPMVMTGAGRHVPPPRPEALVYRPERGPEVPGRVMDSMADLLSGGLANPASWDDLLSEVEPGGRLYVVADTGERFLVVDVLFDLGGETGRLRLRHVGALSRRGDLLVDVRGSYGRILPVVVWRAYPYERNPDDDQA